MSVFAHWNHYELVSFWFIIPLGNCNHDEPSINGTTPPYHSHRVPAPPAPLQAWRPDPTWHVSCPQHRGMGHGMALPLQVMLQVMLGDVLWWSMMYGLMYCIHFVVTNTSGHINKHKHRVYRVQTCSKLFKRVMFNPSGYDLRHVSPLQGQGTRSSEYSFNSSSTRSWASKNRPRFGAIELRYQRIDAIFGEDPFSRIHHIII